MRVLAIVPSLSPRQGGPPYQSTSVCHAVFARGMQARPLVLNSFEATSCSLALRPDDSHHPWRPLQDGLSMGFRSSVSLLPAIQLRGFDSYPDGTYSR